jgi:hypothetical protein
MWIKSHFIDQSSEERKADLELRRFYFDILSGQIRVRAYQLFEACGRQPGRELDDWLQAERETKQQRRIQCLNDILHHYYHSQSWQD